MTAILETATNIDLNSKSALEEFIKQQSMKAHELPLDVKSKLYDFKLNGNKQGYLLFEGLNTEESRESLIQHGSLLGTPYSYIQEGGGNFFHEITPVKKHETEISSQSSMINLDFHTELAFHHFIPHYLMLFCVRGDRTGEAETYVSSVRTSFDEISEDLVKILKQPLFLTGIDYHFGNVDTVKGNGKPVPVLYGDLSDPLFNFDPDLMVPVNEEADRALKELRAILFKNKSTVVLKPGDLLIVDNLRAVHGRSSFKAFYDGQDRFLHRIFVTRDLTRAQEVFSKKERIITYYF